MPDTGFKSASAVTQASGSGSNAPWTLFDQAPGPIARLGAADGIEIAVYVGFSPTISNYVLATAFDFSEIPDAAMITGVAVHFKAYRDPDLPGNHYFEKVFLTADGVTQIGDEISGGHGAQQPFGLSGATANRDYGGPANLWGAVLTPATVKAQTFGIIFQTYSTTNDESGAYVDLCQLKIYYSVPSVPAPRAGSIAASGTLSGAGRTVKSASGSIAGAAALHAYSARIFARAGSVEANAMLSGGIRPVLTRAGSMEAVATLAGESLAMATAAGSIAGAAQFSGEAGAIAGRVGAIRCKPALQGVARALLSAAGAISANANLLAAGRMLRPARGAIVGAGTFLGSAGGVRLTIGHLTAEAKFAGTSIIAVPAAIPPWMFIEIYERGSTTVEIVERGGTIVEI